MQWFVYLGLLKSYLLPVITTALDPDHGLSSQVYTRASIIGNRCATDKAESLHITLTDTAGAALYWLRLRC